MDKDAIERAAIAAYAMSSMRLAFGTDEQAWRAEQELVRDEFRGITRAVLAAVHDPTKKMADCGLHAGWHGGIEGDDECERDAATDLWRRTIAKLLETTL